MKRSQVFLQEDQEEHSHLIVSRESLYINSEAFVGHTGLGVPAVKVGVTHANNELALDL